MDRRKFLNVTPAGAALALGCGSVAAAEVQAADDEWKGIDFFKSATARIGAAPQGGFMAEGDFPFAIYQLSQVEGDKRYKIIDPGGREPQLAGSNEHPDVAMGLKLAGVQFAKSVWDDSAADTRATIRVTTKNRPSNAEDVVHWALTAALNLYQAYKGNKVVSPADLNTPLVGPQQTVQFKGGLGAIQIEVLRHKQPAWWNKVLTFLQGAGGDALIGALGFPAITKTALRFVDEFSNRVSSNGIVPVFSASYASVAFTKAGFKNANNPAALDKGLWLVVSPSAKDTLSEHNAYYYGGFARLIPGQYQEPTTYLKAKTDPFADITYAVLDAELSETKFI